MQISQDRQFRKMFGVHGPAIGAAMMGHSADRSRGWNKDYVH